MIELIVLDWILIVLIPVAVIIMFIAASRFFSSKIRNLIITIIFAYIFLGITSSLTIINHFVVGIENYSTDSYNLISLIEYFTLIGALLFIVKTVDYARAVTRYYGMEERKK